MNNDSSSSWAGSETDTAVRLGSIIWILAVQFFLAQVVVQSAWTTPFSLMWNFISDLGNTACGSYPPDSSSFVCSPWHAWMNGSFILLGLIILFGGVFVYSVFPSGGPRTAGLALLALAGTGTIAVGLFPENVNSTFHQLGAACHFVLGNLAMVALAIALWSAQQRKALAVYSIVSGVTGLIATALFITDHYLGLGRGGIERVAAYPLPIWLTVFGISLFRRVSRSRPTRMPTKWP